jgi:hypothetical protein
MFPATTSGAKQNKKTQQQRAGAKISDRKTT